MIRPDPIRAIRKQVDRGGRTSVYALLVLQQILSSGTHIVAKVITRTMDPAALTLVRSVLSMILMVIVLFISGRFPRIAREDRSLVLWLSFLAIPVNQFFFLFGMRYTIPSNAALLYATTPVLVLLFSWIFLGEKLTGMKVAGMAIAFIGVMVVIFERGFQASMDYLAGNLLLAVAVVAWGLYSVFGKRLIEKYGAIQATSMTLIIGTFMFLPIGIIPAINFPYETLTRGNWMEIGYLAAITSVFSYFLWYFAIGEIEAGKVALFSYLQPVLTSVLTVLLLGQQITTAFLIGGVLALIGVIVAQFSRS